MSPSPPSRSLQASEERYRLLFANNPVPMWVYDKQTLAFLTVNDAAVRHYGYSREEFAKLTLKDIRPAEEVAAMLDDVLNPTDAKVWRHKKKDGTVISVEIRAQDFELDGEVLVFADEQQACGFWAIRRAELLLDDPPLVFGADGEYQDDGCRLEEFLRFLLVANRPFEPPCTSELGPHDFAGWEEVSCRSRHAGGSVYVRGEAAALRESLQVLGARSNDGLREALRSLGEPIDEEALRLAGGPRKMPTEAERKRAFAEWVTRGWLVPRELEPLLGAGAVTKADVLSAVHSYCLRHKLRDRLQVRLDAVLAAASGLEGTQRLDRLASAIAARLISPAPPGVATHRPLARRDPPAQ